MSLICRYVPKAIMRRGLLHVCLNSLDARGLWHVVQVIQGDVLKMDLPYFDVCVANIPYQV
jgi:16S rRNA A1518/A1519 N6-dimethyltransferase RsmA/KsgA/DIM1 with predicted DNA glycosylase/AP lyase activity